MLVKINAGLVRRRQALGLADPPIHHSTLGRADTRSHVNLKKTSQHPRSPTLYPRGNMIAQSPRLQRPPQTRARGPGNNPCSLSHQPLPHSPSVLFFSGQNTEVSPILASHTAAGASPIPGFLASSGSAPAAPCCAAQLVSPSPGGWAGPQGAQRRPPFPLYFSFYG